jgi:hypothetical protein
MKSIAVSLLAIAVTLVGWGSSPVRAEEYVKVEMKGRLRLYNSVPGVISPAVDVDQQPYELDVSRFAAKLPTEKQLKEMDNEVVVVHGNLVLRDKRPWIEVTKIAVSGKPEGKTPGKKTTSGALEGRREWTVAQEGSAVSRPIRSLASARSVRVLAADDPLAPVELFWVGNGIGKGANWSVSENWSGNRSPRVQDTVIFDGAAKFGANTDSKMDIGGLGACHVGKLITRNGYDKTITLASNLFVDQLDIGSNAHIAGPRGLGITQRSDGCGGIPEATLFGSSFLRQGRISAKFFAIYGESRHPAKLWLGSAKQTATLATGLHIVDPYSTVEWRHGNVAVEKGQRVYNVGSFIMNCEGGTMGNRDGAADRWTFQNHRDLYRYDGKFENEALKRGPGSRVFVEDAAQRTGPGRVFVPEPAPEAK